MTEKELTSREKYIELILKERYDPREILGVRAYKEMTDVEEWARKDLKDGHLIEAYAITDQYIDAVIKLSFPEIFYDSYCKEDNKINIGTVLYCFTNFKSVDKKIFQQYRLFKKTRGVLVHKSIFYPKQAKRLKCLSVVKKLPFDIIKDVEELFGKRVIEAYLYFIKNKKKLNNDLMYKNFFVMWHRIWKKQGKNLIEFFNDINELAKTKK